MLELIIRPRSEGTTIVVVDEDGACDNYAIDRMCHIAPMREVFSRLDDLDAHLLKVEADG